MLFFFPILVLLLLRLGHNYLLIVLVLFSVLPTLALLKVIYYFILIALQ